MPENQFQCLEWPTKSFIVYHQKQSYLHLLNPKHIFRLLWFHCTCLLTCNCAQVRFLKGDFETLFQVKHQFRLQRFRDNLWTNPSSINGYTSISLYEGLTVRWTLAELPLFLWTCVSKNIQLSKYVIWFLFQFVGVCVCALGVPLTCHVSVKNTHINWSCHWKKVKVCWCCWWRSRLQLLFPSQTCRSTYWTTRMRDTRSFRDMYVF